jgi:uncharacterized protein
MVTKRDIEFEAEGSVRLRGWLFTPAARQLKPAITMAHGFAGVKEHGLERFAKVFAEAGFVVLVHDHRNFGASDGENRGDVDPWRQIADWRRAISLLESLPEVDPKGIGLWGTSYAGGHAIVSGATDLRLRCIVAQVPTISGYQQGLRRIPPEGVAALEEAFAEDDRAQFRGEPLRRQKVVSDDLSMPAAYRAKDAIAFYLQHVRNGVWENAVTLRSTRAARGYEPGAWVARLADAAAHDRSRPRSRDGERSRALGLRAHPPAQAAHTDCGWALRALHHAVRSLVQRGNRLVSPAPHIE